MTTPIDIFLDPALQAIMPNNTDTMESEGPSAPQKSSQKRNISSRDKLSSIGVPKPKIAKTPAAKPKPPKKTAKNKNQDTPKETGNEEEQPVAPDGERQGEGGEGSDSEDDDESDKQARAPNYLEHEDLQLCTSWLEITEDGRKGTNQTGAAFWETVANHYRSKIPQPLRPLKSIKGHWGLIQAALNKFHGCVNQINHRNPSGTTVANRISMAHTLYSKLHERPFKYMSCYDLLSKAPKWHDYNAAMTKKSEQKKTAATHPSSPLPDSLPSSTPAETVNSTSDASGDETARGELTRPNGRKKAKVAYQVERLDESNHEHLKKMAVAHIDIAEVAKKQHTSLASAMSAQHSALERLADEAIMNKDLTGADDDVKKYYTLQRKRILARLEQELTAPSPAPAPATASSSASAPATIEPAE